MVRLIIILLLLGIVFFAGYMAGMYTRPKAGAKLTRPERKELTALRDFKSSVRSIASSNYELEPNLNRIYMDEVDKTDKSLDSIRSS